MTTEKSVALTVMVSLGGSTKNQGNINIDTAKLMLPGSPNTFVKRLTSSSYTTMQISFTIIVEPYSQVGIWSYDH